MKRKTEKIQMLIDIIDNMDKNDVKRDQYIRILKYKYGYNFIEGDEDEYIENANLNDIKNNADFKSFIKFRLYAEKILRLREKNVDYTKFYNYHPTSISKDELINLMNKYDIKSYFNKTGFISSPHKHEMTINWAGDTFDKSHILHEIAHFFDDEIYIPITYSLTDYGLTNQKECTCDSIMLYLLNPKYYKKLLPEYGKIIEKNIPKWFVYLSYELL